MLKALSAAALAAASTLAMALPAGAATWTPVASGTTQDIMAVEYRTDAQAWLATSNGQLLAADASGAFTVRYSLPGVTFTDIAFRPEGDVGFAVAADGTAYRSLDKGVSWAPVALPQVHDSCSPSARLEPIPRLYALTWAGPDTVYVAGGDGPAVVVRIDGATGGAPSGTDVNWAGSACRVEGPGYPVTDIFAVPGNASALRFISSGFGSIFTSNDGLATIAQETGRMVNAIDAAPRFAVDPANPNRIWAVDHGSHHCDDLCLSYSQTGGASDDPVRIGNDDGSIRRYLFDVAVAGGTFVAVGDNGEIFASTDGANAILTRAPGALAGTNWRAVDVADAQHALVGGIGGTLVRTADAGAGTGPPAPPVVVPPPTPPPTPPPARSRPTPRPAASKPVSRRSGGVRVTLWKQVLRSSGTVPVRLSTRARRRITIVVRRLDRPRRVVARRSVTLRRATRTVRVQLGRNVKPGRYRISVRVFKGKRAVGRAIGFDFRIVA